MFRIHKAHGGFVGHADAKGVISKNGKRKSKKDKIGLLGERGSIFCFQNGLSSVGQLVTNSTIPLVLNCANVVIAKIKISARRTRADIRDVNNTLIGWVDISHNCDKSKITDILNVAAAAVPLLIIPR